MYGELDFDTPRDQRIEYVIDKLWLAESGDEQAQSFVEYVWSADPELMEEAYNLFNAEMRAYDE